MDEGVIVLNYQGSKSNNVCTEDGTSYSLNAMHGHDVHVVCYAPVIVLNDQGGGVMSVSDKANTLRAQDHGHPPVICQQERSTQFSKGGCCYTLTSSDYKKPIIVAYEKRQKILVFKERAGCPGGGKGILIGEDRSFTLSTLLDEAICYPVMSFNPDLGEKASGGMSIVENKSPTIIAGRARAVVYAVENHPNDSRVKLQTDGKVQTMPSRMGTGGGNVPLILEVRNDDLSENHRASDG